MSSIAVKAFLKKPQEPGEYEIRRFNLEANVASSFLHLVGRICIVFPELANKKLKLLWKDSEGDMITFSSDQELMMALEGSSSAETFKIFIEVDPTDAAEKSEPQKSNLKQQKKELHPNITCDGCEGEVRGTRYKCTVCPNYDLCEACKATGLHEEHEMKAFEKPVNGRRHYHHPGHAQFHHHFPPHHHAPPHHHVPPFFTPPPYSGGQPNVPPPPLFSNSNVFGMAAPFVGMGVPFASGADAQKDARKAWKRWWKQVHGFGCDGQNGSKKCKKEEKKSERDGESRDDSEEKKRDEKMEEEHATAKDNNAGAGSTGSSSEDEDPRTAQAEYLRSVGQSVAAMLDPLGISVEVDVEHNGKKHHCHKKANLKNAGEYFKDFTFPGGCAWVFQGPGTGGVGVQTSSGTFSQSHSQSQSQSTSGATPTNTNASNGTTTTTTFTTGPNGATTKMTTVTSTKTSSSSSSSSSTTTTDCKPKETAEGAAAAQKNPETSPGSLEDKSPESDWTFVKDDDMVSESTVSMQKLKIGQDDPVILNAVDHMQLMGFEDDGKGGDLYELLTSLSGDISKAIDVINFNKKMQEKKD
ncbi:hypothetical protein HELRODRAFT_174776 [Helobdella robusta]|uniref:ZZ-type domain-containing protein n=1 Tax=Helobdella robusta TaxID=6412 RepID=T1F8G5_HELRO|nr:hypothetical protein HELRODRAFT_174776 [Helobdella robusta]ESO01230.1 hypothetical protein HELRODRAFT_174776 [Helobdella robusta]